MTASIRFSTPFSPSSPRAVDVNGLGAASSATSSQSSIASSSEPAPDFRSVMEEQFQALTGGGQATQGSSSFVLDVNQKTLSASLSPSATQITPQSHSSPVRAPNRATQSTPIESRRQTTPRDAAKAADVNSSPTVTEAKTSPVSRRPGSFGARSQEGSAEGENEPSSTAADTANSSGQAGTQDAGTQDAGAQGAQDRRDAAASSAPATQAATNISAQTNLSTKASGASAQDECGPTPSDSTPSYGSDSQGNAAAQSSATLVSQSLNPSGQPSPDIGGQADGKAHAGVLPAPASAPGNSGNLAGPNLSIQVPTAGLQPTPDSGSAQAAPSQPALAQPDASKTRSSQGNASADWSPDSGDPRIESSASAPTDASGAVAFEANLSPSNLSQSNLSPSNVSPSNHFVITGRARGR